MNDLIGISQDQLDLFALNQYNEQMSFRYAQHAYNSAKDSLAIAYEIKQLGTMSSNEWDMLQSKRGVLIQDIALYMCGLSANKRKIESLVRLCKKYPITKTGLDNLITFFACFDENKALKLKNRLAKYTR